MRQGVLCFYIGLLVRARVHAQVGMIMANMLRPEQQFRHDRIVDAGS